MLDHIASPRAAAGILPLCIVVICSVFVTPPATAGEVPGSAYSRSLGITPLLLDDVGLMFRFPQLAASYRAQAVALGVSGNSSSNTTGLGASAHAGRNALFILVQPAVDIAPLVGRSRAFQLGWGREFDRLRLGVALRGSRSVEGHGSTSGSPDVRRDEFNNNNSHVLEGALGFGYGDADGFLDLVVELRSQETDEDRRRGTYAPNDTLTWRVRRQLRDDLSPAVALRAGRTLESGIRLVAAGDWTEDRLDGDVEVTYDEHGFQQPGGDYYRRWTVGFAGTGTPGRAGDLTLFGDYAREDRDLTAANSQSVDRSATTVDVGLLGIGIERNIWRRLDGLAGLRAQYTRTKSQIDSWVLSYPGVSHVQSRYQERETWSDRFGWGLAYRHDRFHIIGSIDSRLNLENLVLTLDARFLF